MRRLAIKGRALLSEKTSHHILINAAGNVSNFVLSGIVTVLLARVFPPSTFGTLSILLVISYLLANVLSFGFPATIYAHVPTLRTDRHLTLRFLMTQFITLCGLSTGVLILLLGAIPFFKSADSKVRSASHVLHNGICRYRTFFVEQLPQGLPQCIG
ncbi:MAG: Polysaccharide biosynthesis protein [Microgenomates bacterium OLB22]|nr:MAG: Polysaccharide biosynthesis protein [Microgenomates bacterium OLB22]